MMETKSADMVAAEGAIKAIERLQLQARRIPFLYSGKSGHKQIVQRAHVLGLLEAALADARAFHAQAVKAQREHQAGKMQ